MNSLLAVEGMFCAGCARALERQLSRLPSIDRAQVSLQAGCLWVEWRELPCLEEIEACASRMGYRILPMGQALEVANPFRMRMVVSVFFTMWAMMASAPLTLRFELEPSGQALLACLALVLSLPVNTYAAWPFFRMAWINLRGGRLGSDFQIAGATLACLALSLVDWPHVYVEGSCVLVSASLLARMWEAESARDARKILAEILGKTELAGCQAGRGQTTQWAVASVLGVDGVVVAGAGLVDQSFLSGESLPTTVVVGDTVYAGSRLLQGPLTIQVTAEPGRRRLDGWLRGMAGASARKGSWESWTEQAIVPWNMAVLGLLFALGGAAALGFLDVASLGRRLLLVVTAACPCAFTLAIPLLMRRLRLEAGRHRVYFRDLRAVQELSVVRSWIFDKTGTLTRGRPRLVEVQCGGGSASHWGTVAARLSFAQPHPLGQALRQAFPLDSGQPLDTVVLVPGQGIACPEEQTFLGKCEWIRNLGFVAEVGEESLRSACDLVYRGQWRARFLFEDELRPGLAQLPGPRSLCSGDHAGAVSALVDSAGLPWMNVWHSQSPEQKLARLESCGPATAYVGDGINDVLVLSGASPGIGLGYSSSAALEAASVVVNDLPGLQKAQCLARWFRSKAKTALAFSFVYNALLLPAAVWGWLDPGWTAAAMGCSSLAVVLVASTGGLRLHPVPPLRTTKY